MTQSFVKFAQIFKQHNILDFYYFHSHRVCNAYCWAIIEGGVIKRVFMESGGDDRYEQGKVTLEELQEGLQPAFNFDDEVSDEMWETAWSPSEETVMDLAAVWSERVDDLEALYPKQLSVGIVLTQQLRKI